ncbi:MAG: hypothetical protein AABY28_00700 [Candidatus Omnitrophota bacterium]|mgnify:CR=1 FL=1
MNYQHKYLAAGRWSRLSFFEQMANIGSEVERALNWRAKHNTAYCQQAFERALELIGLTLDGVTNSSHFKELARLREVIVDYFFGANQFMSTESLLRNYFLSFTYAARRNH